MQQSDTTPPLSDARQAGNAQPLIDVPPKLPLASDRQSFLRQLLTALLSLCLGFFLIDAVVSLVDDLAALCIGLHVLLAIRLIAGFFAVLVALIVYILMALTPAIPKRLFVPLAFFYLVTQLISFPLFFYYPDHLQQIATIISLVQVALGLWTLYRTQHALKLCWPLVPPAWSDGRLFSWKNLVGFVLANIFGVLPAVILYGFFCTAGLVNHFTDGFMTLRPGGFTVQVKKYVRDDGKTIQLFPMSHVAESDFYQNIAQTFPTNSLILMEGVTDEKHLLKHKINYQRMANTLHLAEQHEAFEPTRGEIVPADIDVAEFTTNTIDLLNIVTLIHTGGVNPLAIQALMQYATAPYFLERLLDDLIRKRNDHLLEQIHLHLPETEHIIVPWGVAHMPGIAREIEKAGFRVEETKTYEVIRLFHSKRSRPNLPKN